MCKFFLTIVLFCFVMTSAHSQRDDREKAKMERYEEDMKKKQAEFISDFVNSLKVDEFQKEIISQKLHSYYETKKAILMADLESFRRKEILDELDNTHFSDIEEMCGEAVMKQITELIKQKPKKRKKRRN